MAHLTLAGVSDDGKRLLLVSDSGIEFTLDLDARLRSALRGDSSRLGQLEIQMDSTLRPRDIQARIRAGETPEAVAQAAQTSVDKIMSFAAPVLAERQHVAERAQRSSVRRKAGETAGQARTLGDCVEAHLRSTNVDPDTVEWDAWRREDGRWALTGEFTSIKRKGTAQFTYDAPGNYVTLENDDAKWLVGEGVAAIPSSSATQSAAARDDLQHARQRRLSSVPEDELPLGDDALELVKDPPVEPDEPLEPNDSTVDLTETAVEIRAEADPDGALATDEDQSSHDPADNEPASRRPVKKNRGRASVPSWDEIMFGGGKQD